MTRACRRMSLIEEDGEQRVRMAHLAIVGSHAVNGVAELHTEILTTRVFRDFHELWPDRFSNKTNGVTQRRWLLKSNPDLSRIISEAIGTRWVTDLDELKRLVPLADDSGFAEAWRAAKRQQKLELAAIIERQYEKRGLALRVSPDSLFDVQVKRIHEYKRQLLNLLHVITLVQSHHGPPARRLRPPDRHLRRQGRARVRHGQADHPPDQRGGRRGEQRRRGRRSPQGRVHRRLPRVAGRADLPRRRAVRADLHGRDGGLGHQQHEVRPERGAHHRHHGRRDRRDPPGGRRRQHLHLRLDGRRGGGPPTALRPVGVLPDERRSSGACWT